MSAAGTGGLKVVVEHRDAGWRDAEPRAEGICRRAARAAARAAGVALDNAEVSIVLGDDALLRGLNRDWRAIDAPTNVLAFPCDGPRPSGAEPALLGDVVISLQTTAAEARRDGLPLADHLAHLVAHGVLHLLGYDHQTDAEADEMEALEASALAGLDIANPYAELSRAGAGPDS